MLSLKLTPAALQKALIAQPLDCDGGGSKRDKGLEAEDEALRDHRPAHVPQGRAALQRHRRTLRVGLERSERSGDCECSDDALLEHGVVVSARCVSIRDAEEPEHERQTVACQLPLRGEVRRLEQCNRCEGHATEDEGSSAGLGALDAIFLEAALWHRAAARQTGARRHGMVQVHQGGRKEAQHADKLLFFARRMNEEQVSPSQLPPTCSGCAAHPLAAAAALLALVA